MTLTSLFQQKRAAAIAARAANPAPEPSVERSLSAASPKAAAEKLVTVTVAPGRSIGALSGGKPKGPGATLEVTEAEAARLRKLKFVL